MEIVIIVGCGVLGSILIGGTYIGTVAAVAYTVFKALTKKR